MSDGRRSNWCNLDIMSVTVDGTIGDSQCARCGSNGRNQDQVIKVVFESKVLPYNTEGFKLTLSRYARPVRLGSHTPHPHQADCNSETTSLDKMQKKTVDYVQSTHPVNDPEIAPTHATYACEEISGSLSSAGTCVSEFEGVVGNDSWSTSSVRECYTVYG